MILLLLLAAPSYPVAAAERPLILPHLTISPWVAGVLYKPGPATQVSSAELDACRTANIGPCFEAGPSGFAGDVAAGIDLGLFDLLEVGLSPARIRLAPRADYRSGRLRVEVQPVSGVIDVSIAMSTTTDFRGYWILQPAVALRGHVADLLAVDLNVELQHWIRPEIDARLRFPFDASLASQDITSLFIPVAVILQATDRLYVRAESGVRFINLPDVDEIQVPLELELGYTVGAPFLDIGAWLRFPQLGTFRDSAFSTAVGQTSNTVTNVYELGLSAVFYLFL